MEKRAVRVFLVVGTWVLLTCWPYPVSPTAPFRVRVIDEPTGYGLPDLRVLVEDGTTGDTQVDGSLVFWLNTALMNRIVRFTIYHHGVATIVRLPVSPGGLVAVAVSAP